jgi:hypothetical protein
MLEPSPILVIGTRIRVSKKPNPEPQELYIYLCKELEPKTKIILIYFLKQYPEVVFFTKVKNCPHTEMCL